MYSGGCQRWSCLPTRPLQEKCHWRSRPAMTSKWARKESKGRRQKWESLLLECLIKANSLLSGIKANPSFLISLTTKKFPLSSKLSFVFYGTLKSNHHKRQLWRMLTQAGGQQSGPLALQRILEYSPCGTDKLPFYSLCLLVCFPSLFGEQEGEWTCVSAVFNSWFSCLLLWFINIKEGIR